MEPSVWATRAQARLNGNPSLADLDERPRRQRRSRRQRIASEVESGSDTLARTLTHAAVAVASAVGAPKAPKSVNTVLSTFRGYALLIWVLVSYLTGGSQSRPQRPQSHRRRGGRPRRAHAGGAGRPHRGHPHRHRPVARCDECGRAASGATPVLAARGPADRRVPGRRGDVGCVVAYPMFSGGAEVQRVLLGGAVRVAVVVAVILFGVFVAGSGRGPRRRPQVSGRHPLRPRGRRGQQTGHSSGRRPGHFAS